MTAIFITEGGDKIFLSSVQLQIPSHSSLPHILLGKPVIQNIANQVTSSL